MKTGIKEPDFEAYTLGFEARLFQNKTAEIQKNPFCFENENFKWKSWNKGFGHGIGL